MTATAKKAKAPPRPMSQKERLEEFYHYVDLCFAALDEPDLKEVANLTKLHPSTLWRLATHNFTLAVHAGTIQALGLAAGLNLTWEHSRPVVCLAR